MTDHKSRGSIPNPRIEQELKAGEKLRWWGRSGGRGYRIHPVFSTLFSLFALYLVGVTGLVLFENLNLIDRYPGLTWDTGDTIFTGVGILFMLGFVFLAIIPWIGHRWERKKKICAVTDRRALILSKKPGKEGSLQSLSPKDINRLKAREHPDGWGNLTIRQQRHITTLKVRLDAMLPVDGLLPKVPVPVGFSIQWTRFEDVPDVRGGAEALSEIVDISPDIRKAIPHRLLGHLRGERGAQS